MNDNDELDDDGPMRAETGVVQFGDDWPGVFIRGDVALMGYLPALRSMLAGTDAPLHRALLGGLVELLASCQVKAGEVRVDNCETLRPFESCRPASVLALGDLAQELADVYRNLAAVQTRCTAQEAELRAFRSAWQVVQKEEAERGQDVGYFDAVLAGARKRFTP